MYHKNMMKRLAIIALSLCGVLTACNAGSSGAPGSTPILPGLPNASSSSKTIPASSGGDIFLGRMIAVRVEPNVLSVDQNVRVDFSPTLRESAPNPGWAVASGELSVTIPQGTNDRRHVMEIYRSRRDVPDGITLRLPYSLNDAVGVQDARAPLVTLVTPEGARRIVLDGTFDTVNRIATVTIPRPMLKDVTAIHLALGMNAVTPNARGAQSITIQTGGRYWNDSTRQWSAVPTSVDPNARTLVVVHGIFSSVESSYPCAHDYMTTASSQPGAYQQVVGFDYDYTEPPSVNGPRLAAFINGLQLSDYDIEAHSYGTLVALGALHNLSVQPYRAILVGGPLPLRGSPLVTSPWIRDILLSLASVTLATPQQVDNALDSGMVQSLAPDSQELQALRAEVYSLPAPPRFDRVAGTKQYWEEDLFSWALWGTIQYPWDGVVEESAAESNDLPYNRQIAIPFQHVGLPCDAPTIAFVLASK